jgi:hypothetical protein
VAMDDGEYCILREETVRERRGSYNEICCRLYPFICWIIIKEGPGNFSGGRSPHWVNHVNLCLSCIVCLLCFVSAFVLEYRRWCARFTIDDTLVTQPQAEASLRAP